ALAVGEVVDDVVIRSAVGDSGRHVVEIEQMANLPANGMITAGRVATHAQPAHDVAVGIIEREAAAKDIRPADSLADYEVPFGPIVLRLSSERDFLVDRVGV